jgi:hypothetical protein
MSASFTLASIGSPSDLKGGADDGEVSGDAGQARKTCLSGATAVTVALEISPESLQRPDRTFQARHGPSVATCHRILL